MKVYLVEVEVRVDDDEDSKDKRQEITRAIENLDPSIGIFTVENITE